MKRRLATASILAALLVLALTLTVVPAHALDEPDRLFMVGEHALADRFYPVARRTLERFVAQYPREARLPRALLLLGRARLALDDPQAALGAFDRAQRLLTAPADVLEAKFWHAEALFRLKRFAEARTGYDEVVRTDAASPLAPDALYGFAWSEMELKNPEGAVTALRELLAAWPEHALAPAASLQLARAYIELTRVEEALPLLTPFASRFPDSRLIPDAQFLTGWAKFNSGDRAGAMADLQAFVSAHPKHAQAAAARVLIARAAVRHGNRAQMERAYKTLMEQLPATAEAVYDAGEIATKLARSRDAEAAWQKLRTSFPNHPLTHRRAWDLASTAFKQKNWKDAVALGQVATQSEEPSMRAEAWLLVGESELQLKRYASAEKAFEAVGAAGDVDAGVRYRALAGLGLAHEQQKAWQAALGAYESVASSSPDPALRNWAQERASAVKGQLTRSGNGKPANGGGAPAPRRTDPGKSNDRSGGKRS